MARTGLTFPGGVCIWVGCSNSFEGELPPDWLWLITYWSPEPTLGMGLDDEEIGNIPTRHGRCAASMLVNSRRYGSHHASLAQRAKAE